MKFTRSVLVALCSVTCCFAADVTGNWVAEHPSSDGYVRKTYFDLKQEGSQITGHVRTGQFYFPTCNSTGAADNFTLTCTMKDGNNERHAVYEGKLVGDELHMATRRRPEAPAALASWKRA